MDEAKVDAQGVALADGTRTTQNTYDLAMFGTDGAGEVDKDPTVTIRKESEDCYIFIAVDNTLPDYFTIKYSDKWIKVAENKTTAMYAYREVIDTSKDDDQVLEPLFKKVKCTKELSEEKMTELSESTIKLTAYALQKDGFTEEEALENAVKAFKNLENSPYDLSTDNIISESKNFLDEVKEDEE